MTFNDAVAYALTLDGAAILTSYRQPAVKANGIAFLNVGHQPETSFVLNLDPGVIEAMMDNHPETFWKTPHYEGYPSVLVRYDSPHGDLVREMIESAYERAKAKKPPRPKASTRKA